MTMRSLLAASLVLAALTAGAGEAEVGVRAVPANWRSSSLLPVLVDARSPVGGRLVVQVGQGEALSRRRVEVPAGTPVRVELPAPARDYLHVSWTFNGAPGEPTTLSPSIRGGPGLLCLNGALLAEAADEYSRSGYAVQPVPIALDMLPAMWQSYAGLTAVLVVADRDVERLSPEQRAALTGWVRWLGGRLAMTGPDSAAALEKLDLSPDSLSPVKADGAEIYQAFSGRVAVLPGPDMGVLRVMADGDIPEHPLESYLTPWGYYAFAPPFLRGEKRLGGVGAFAICAVLAVLVVLMGPVNFWYVRRRKNALLFFVTTPLLAVFGVAAIFLLSVATEGLGGRYVEHAALFRPRGGEQALLLDVLAVRPGFTTQNLVFEKDALVFPAGSGGGDRIAVGYDYTDGVALSGGWFRPRAVSVLAAARPVTPRMRVDIEEGPDGAFVVNNLGFTLTAVAARLADGRIGHAEAVPPGERRPLAKENNRSRLDTLLAGMDDLSGHQDFRERVWLAAECAGLPYLDHGGLAARRVGGRYFYYETDSGRAR